MQDSEIREAERRETIEELGVVDLGFHDSPPKC